MRDPLDRSDDPWLVRPTTIELLWKIFAAALGLSVLADLFVHHHSSFGVDGTFGFGAWFGFVSCGVLVLVAKGVSLLLQRPDHYYGE